MPQLVDGHTYTITARATDVAGNSSTTTRTFVFDSTAPAVTNVTASTANGIYTTGAVVHVQIAFSKNVSVTGTPKLTLNTAPSETASYASGSGTSTLTFDYTVQAGDNAATLDYASSGALALERRHDPRRGDERCDAHAPDARRGRLALREQVDRDRHAGADRHLA